VSGYALWNVSPGRAELRPARPAHSQAGEVEVRALVSGISRGTEKLVFQGKVPPSEWTRMRCPFQEGAFPFPVKYGYGMVGRVSDGPGKSRRVFSLYPHQSLFSVPTDTVLEVPDDVSTERAALAAQMETALNATWDAPPHAGMRIAVVGGGVIGALTAYLCARVPGTKTVLIDTNPVRAELAAALGVDFALPDAPDSIIGDCDLVFHASATAAGLNRALALARFEGEIIELSWYGDAPVAVELGGAFHSQRLSLRASQVGAVAPSHRKACSHRDRLAQALALCADPRLDILVREETSFTEIAAKLEAILAAPNTLCHLIRYQES
jgi:NADPH:quinone reductase-like Zn-dependent oxidoreductase